MTINAKDALHGECVSRKLEWEVQIKNRFEANWRPAGVRFSLWAQDNAIEAMRQLETTPAFKANGYAARLVKIETAIYEIPREIIDAR